MNATEANKHLKEIKEKHSALQHVLTIIEHATDTKLITADNEENNEKIKTVKKMKDNLGHIIVGLERALKKTNVEYFGLEGHYL